MAESSELEVRYEAKTVGRLVSDDLGRMTFAYAPSWREDADAFAISISLPLRTQPYSGEAGHAFFANLLPEGEVRTAVCKRLGISADNDMALLRAIGGDCAGALSIVEPGASKTLPKRYSYEELDDRRLQALASSKLGVPLLIGGAKTRLSLAGAQDKVPVAVIDDEIAIPTNGGPSTHILKLPHRDYAHLPVNEAFVMGLAAAVGMDVAPVELVHRTNPPSLLVARYDRVRSDNPAPARRLHQEDLCQALGLASTRKYEEEGGPSLVAAIALVRRSVRQPILQVQRLVEWQAFNIVAGNSDGHGKNLSLLYDQTTPRLAPFYDLLATRHYDALDRRLAMRVGSKRDPDLVGRKQWEALAADLAIMPRAVLDIVRGLIERCIEKLGPWAEDFRELHGSQAVLQTLPRTIMKRANRAYRSLA